MRDGYNIKELNPKKNSYASRLKKQISINIDISTIDYFKSTVPRLKQMHPLSALD